MSEPDSHLWRDTHDDPPPDDTEIAGGWITPAGHIDVLPITYDSSNLIWTYDDMPCTPPHAWHPLPCIPPTEPPATDRVQPVKPVKPVPPRTVMFLLVAVFLAALGLGVLFGSILPGGIATAQWVCIASYGLALLVLIPTRDAIRRR
jgi:hypothetical protein